MGNHRTAAFVLCNVFRPSVHSDEQIALSDCAVQPLAGGFSDSPLYRAQGQVNSRAGVKPWSLILKVIQPTTGSQEPWQRDYWKRELLVYQSDLHATLPGDLAAPRCLGITEQAAEGFWLWLEDLGRMTKAPGKWRNVLFL